MRRDQRSDEAREYRRLYDTARWTRTRDAQLLAEPLCQRCKARGFIVTATVCNHDDPASKATDFFAGPFSSLCAQCHDSPVQSEERTGKPNKRIGFRTDVSPRTGVPTDPRHPFFAG